jgi:LysR family transcriptional activator of nhaA
MDAAARLNYRHLGYFRAVAKSGNLTRAARDLHVSQSALSVQIRKLEQHLGHDLFRREGRSLVLTEAGHVALNYAETIFGAGGELVALLRQGRSAGRQRLRVGGVATLSRNFQENFIKPLLAQPGLELVLASGSLEELLDRLRVHELDVVLSNRPAPADARQPWRTQRIARQPVSLVGRPRRARRPFEFRAGLRGEPLLLPGPASEIRRQFDVLCEELDVAVEVRAEVDDMAMLRLLARDSEALALLPPVVVQDELAAGRLREYCRVPGISEDFYAIAMPRRFRPAALRRLLERSESEVLGPVAPPAAAESA